MERGIERHEGLPRRIVEIERVLRRRGIVAFARQLVLLVLEGRGDLDAVLDAQKQRPRVGRQSARKMRAQRREIERVIRDDRRHAGRAFGGRHGYAVHGRLGHAGKLRDRFGDLRGRDVLAFPAERVADAIDEIKEAAGILAHEIAGAIPGVAAGKHVAQDLALRFRLVGIALERTAGF